MLVTVVPSAMEKNNDQHMTLLQSLALVLLENNALLNVSFFVIWIVVMLTWRKFKETSGLQVLLFREKKKSAKIPAG